MIPKRSNIEIQLQYCFLCSSVRSSRVTRDGPLSFKKCNTQTRPDQCHTTARNALSSVFSADSPRPQGSIAGMSDVERGGGDAAALVMGGLESHKGESVQHVGGTAEQEDEAQD